MKSGTLIPRDRPEETGDGAHVAAPLSAEDRLILMVAEMVSDWETSGESASEFARRLLGTLRRTGFQIDGEPIPKLNREA
jgi:hypothetical protein